MSNQGEIRAGIEAFDLNDDIICYDVTSCTDITKV